MNFQKIYRESLEETKSYFSSFKDGLDNNKRWVYEDRVYLPEGWSLRPTKNGEKNCFCLKDLTKDEKEILGQDYDDFIEKWEDVLKDNSIKSLGKHMGFLTINCWDAADNVEMNDIAVRDAFDKVEISDRLMDMAHGKLEKAYNLAGQNAIFGEIPGLWKFTPKFEKVLTDMKKELDDLKAELN